jgi:predicted amidohydrolase
MPGGYTLTEAIWDTAKPFDGTTTQWLRALAKRLNIYLGTSFIEADDEDFYNTFVLVNPLGQVAGRVRKIHQLHSRPISFALGMTVTGLIFPLVGSVLVYA